MNPENIKKNTTILESIIDTDQQGIKDFKAGKISSQELRNLNKNHTEIVKNVIKEIGFPTIKLTSQKAYKAAILVVLHSEDIDFLNTVIDLLQKTEKGSIEKRDIAYMIDKVKVIQNLPQVYGTQYRIDSSKNVTFIEISDPENLESRRQDMEMESFEEYKKKISI